MDWKDIESNNLDFNNLDSNNFESKKLDSIKLEPQIEDIIIDINNDIKNIDEEIHEDKKFEEDSLNIKTNDKKSPIKVKQQDKKKKLNKTNQKVNNDATKEDLSKLDKELNSSFEELKKFHKKEKLLLFDSHCHPHESPESLHVLPKLNISGAALMSSVEREWSVVESIHLSDPERFICCFGSIIHFVKAI